MKLHASVLAVAGAFSLAALAGITVACQSVTESPGATTSASPIAAPASPSLSPSPRSPSLSPSPASVPTTTRTIAQKQTGTTNPSSAANRTVETCVVKMALIDDPNPPLNVRSAPTTDGTNVVGQLKNGTFVTVADDQNGWLQIKTPLKGWISKQQTANGCNQKVERVSLSADSVPLQVADRFVGIGSHRYVLPAKQGQTLTITRDRGPFPMIMAPDGTVLLGHEKDDERSTWSGQLAQTGDYRIELESNFKGYRYAFSMQMK